MTMRTDNPRWGAPRIRTRSIRAGLAAPRAVSTIHRILQRCGVVTAPIRRSPRTWRRFERFAPNDLWQIDGTQVELVGASKAWVFDLLDDQARYGIAATAIDERGTPRQLISDNGMQFKSGKRREIEVLPGTTHRIGYHPAVVAAAASADLRQVGALSPHLQGVLRRPRSQAYETLPTVAPGDPRPKRRNHGPRTFKVAKAGSFNYRNARSTSGTPISAST
ncbi:hypothetical protein [Antrihabitans stalactiti]|uniref:Transposase family protein n=1 Tax=Antrihabitans stalactiti TaxID=2584121 RepID=A0A848KAD8_9NOCA|nr:hypothetical protein [Antrihabitans stalactiti]NMN95331.1 transposase family protein [Antrihabitans stalactiti]